MVCCLALHIFPHPLLRSCFPAFDAGDQHERDQQRDRASDITAL